MSRYFSLFLLDCQLLGQYWKQFTAKGWIGRQFFFHNLHLTFKQTVTTIAISLFLTCFQDNRHYWWLFLHFYFIYLFIYFFSNTHQHLYPVMANGIRIGDPRGFNKGRSSKLRVGSRVRQTSEIGRRTYRPKRCGNNNEDKDNSPKTFHDKKIIDPRIRKLGNWYISIIESYEKQRNIHHELVKKLNKKYLKLKTNFLENDLIWHLMNRKKLRCRKTKQPTNHLHALSVGLKIYLVNLQTGQAIIISLCLVSKQELPWLVWPGF